MTGFLGEGEAVFNISICFDWKVLKKDMESSLKVIQKEICSLAIINRV